MNTEFSGLVKKARAGDADSFAKLYESIYQELYRFAYSNLKNQHDASDAVSDAVLEAFSSIKNLRDENAFKAWMFKILTVKIKNKQREYIKEKSYRAESVDSEVHSALGVEHEGKEEISYSNIEFMEEFKKLNEDERLVLSLSVISGYKSEEIAVLVGMSANTVRSKAARAKIKLRSMLS